MFLRFVPVAVALSAAAPGTAQTCEDLRETTVDFVRSYEDMTLYIDLLAEAVDIIEAEGGYGALHGTAIEIFGLEPLQRQLLTMRSRMNAARNRLNALCPE
ncbi:hypothetical protein HKCCE4037_06430 [Rhodobacterales bacterium HKCCE4037]|nr:hypothetical protein [Rhodobacterales bacterium HKCCE4037]